ncbi:MAG TPA: mannose-6-phosphate isomerase, class I [Chitinophagaceae bacterium]
MAGIARLTGTAKHYDWGGDSFIPSLLNIEDTKGKPFAEYWLGVHPLADCNVIMPGEPPLLLRDMIHSQPAATLGEYVYHRFGDLPYLLKVLDVKDMLSIQVHPSKAEAEKEFAEEDKKGIPLNAPGRNYKDKNHKPELIAAIGEFWLLHGFKSKDKIVRVLQDVKELSSLLPVFESSGYAGVYKKVMEMAHAEVNNILQPLLDRIIPMYQSGKLKKAQEDFWAARAALTFSQGKNIDRGIFSVYLFNLVQLQKGQAIFQDAGVPHAYLEGQNVEIMASSDNVLRGGLTTKHIDVKELLKHVKCEPTIVNILNGEKSGSSIVYKTTAPDFELFAYDLKAGESISLAATTTEILLTVKGSAELRENAEVVAMGTGSPSGIIFSGHTAQLVAKESSLVFKAGVPTAGVNK